MKPSLFKYKEIRIITIFTVLTVISLITINLSSLYNLNTLHDITEEIYNHPLKVSNAALNIQKNVLKIHRDMKDVVLFSTEMELSNLIKKVNDEEKKVYKYLNIIKINILGKEGLKLHNNTYQLFKEWKPIRDEVIELINQKKTDAAIEITKQIGAKHVQKLESSAMNLNRYAQNKATSFKNKAHSTFEQFKYTNILLTMFILFIFIYFILYIQKKIKEFIQSISESENNFKKLNERFNLAIDGTDDGLWDWNLEDKTIYFSANWKKMLGYKEYELSNELETWRSRVHPEDLAQAIKDIELAHSSPHKYYHNVHRMRHKDGSWVWILDRGKTIFDEHSKPIRMIGFHTNITKLKELELELIEKEYLLKEAQRLSKMGSWKLDFSTNKLTWSDEIFNIFNLDKDKFTPAYQTFIDIIHPEDREAVDAKYSNSLKTGKPYRITHRLLMKNQKVKYVIESCETTFDSNQNPLISIGTVQDITEQKLLEDKLTSLKQQFEQFMEYMPANIIIKEKDKVIYANSSSATFFNKDSILGKTLKDLFPSKIVNRLKEFEQKVLDKGKAEEILEILNSENEKKIYRHMSFVIDSKDKQRLGIVSIDITKEYQANKEIARVLSAFDRSNVSVIITNLAGDIEYVNPSWCKITGYTKEELIGQNPRIVKSGYVSQENYKKMWNELTQGKVWNSELKNRAKNGTEFWEDSTIIPSFNEDGIIDGYIAFKLEISDKIRLKQELKDKEEIMIAQSRHAAMGEMISMIAHQWRQPISVIAMDANNILVDIELKSVEDESLKDDITDILEQTNYLSKTIDDFRNFFKPSKVKDYILISDILIESLSVVSKSLENHNIEVIKNFNTRSKVHLFSRELLQVFINILKNAKEAFEENTINEKSINITINEDKNNVIVSLCDNAGGIDNKIIEDIFNPYFTTKEEKTGTGLGLYMSKTIVEKHLKGSLNVYNKKDGVCFEIKIPIQGMD